MKKVKKVRGWAIISETRLAIYDCRLPIFWLKQVAELENKEKFNNKQNIVPITIIYQVKEGK